MIAELERRGLKVRRPDRHLATIDHSTPTTPPDENGEYAWTTDQARRQVEMGQRFVYCYYGGIDKIAHERGFTFVVVTCSECAYAALLDTKTIGVSLTG